PELAFRKDWNPEVMEFPAGGAPRDLFLDDPTASPVPRAGDILTLVLHGRDAPATGHYAMVLAANMSEHDRGLVYVASGSTGPMRTVAVDLFRIEPIDPSFEPRHPLAPARPRDGSAWITEILRTSLLLPTRRIGHYRKKAFEQLKV